MSISSFFRTSLLTTSLLTFAAFSTCVALAGGGTYQLNMDNPEIVPGNQRDIVVTVTDNTKSDFPLLVGEEFELVAHPESSGEGCVTYQKKTDANGQFRGRCYSDVNGKFAFHIHPITRGDLPDSGAWEIYFQIPAPTTAPKPTSPTPVASPKASVRPTPTPSPRPSMVASPSPTSTAFAQPTALPTLPPTSTPATPPQTGTLFQPPYVEAVGLVTIGALGSVAALMGWKSLSKKLKK